MKTTTLLFIFFIAIGSPMINALLCAPIFGYLIESTGKAIIEDWSGKYVLR